MKVYTCTSFQGRYPVGTAAVVVASSAKCAAELLSVELLAWDLPNKILPEQMAELDLSAPDVVILCDGDY